MNMPSVFKTTAPYVIDYYILLIDLKLRSARRCPLQPCVFYGPLAEG